MSDYLLERVMVKYDVADQDVSGGATRRNLLPTKQFYFIRTDLAKLFPLENSEERPASDQYFYQFTNESEQQSRSQNMHPHVVYREDDGRETQPVELNAYLWPTTSVNFLEDYLWPYTRDAPEPHF